MKTGESPEAHRPASLVFIVINKRPCLKIRWKTRTSTMKLSFEPHTYTVAYVHPHSHIHTHTASTDIHTNKRIQVGEAKVSGRERLRVKRMLITKP